MGEGNNNYGKTGEGELWDMNVISYVLFGDEEDKVFWDSIPFLLVVNTILLEGFHLRFYVHSDCQKFDGFPQLKEMSERFKHIEVIIVDRPYTGTEPTTWRLMPLWDTGVEYCFCRDVDSAPTIAEIKSMIAFMRSGHIIHSIRSHHLHTTSIMAGLCGFNCPALRNQDFFPPSFDDYVKMGGANTQCPDWVWGCDQELLRRFFHKEGRDYLQRHTIDTPLGDAPIELGGYNPIQLPQEKYDEVDLAELDQTVLNLCDNMMDYEGQAIHVRKEKTTSVLMIPRFIAENVREVYKDYEYGSDSCCKP